MDRGCLVITHQVNVWVNDWLNEWMDGKFFRILLNEVYWFDWFCWLDWLVVWSSSDSLPSSLNNVHAHVCPIPVMPTTLYPIFHSLSRTTLGGSSVLYSGKSFPNRVCIFADNFSISSGSDHLSPTMVGPLSFDRTSQYSQYSFIRLTILTWVEMRR